MFVVFLLEFWNESYICEACNKREVNKKCHDFLLTDFMTIGCLVDRSGDIILLEQILNMRCEMKQVDFKCCKDRVM